jgi:hypothetical protein
MRKIMIAFLLAVSASLTAQQPGVHADANPAAESEIKALELKLAGLILRATARANSHPAMPEPASRRKGESPPRKRARLGLGHSTVTCHSF